MKRLAIVACGRSGTRYMSKVLRAVGLDVGHEKAGNYGLIDWHLAGSPFDLEGYGVILHQVRQPVSVIDSFQTVMKRTWSFICDADERIPREDDVLLRSMKHWLYWNQSCELIASRTYRVEQIPGLLPELLKALGETVSEGAMERAASVSTMDHAREDNIVRQQVSDSCPRATWERMEARDKILTAQVRAQAEKYGYEFPK